MPTAQLRQAVPLPYQILLLTALGGSLAYALITAHILLWFLSVAVVVSLGLGVVLVSLFYRLVVAVERIADER
ncbi:hypothetical protein [Natronosalvus caseinilyticus]|uniref:hypothetical protein n=1 Tax=Natronosalvus caseinilyticus TaxID=2953747 RepID=UPI0028AA6913|nr:hypothetical protein [Natronosalvus caseinilyticus]